MPLSMANKNKCCRIINIIGGRGIKQRLSSLGIYPSNFVKIIKNDFVGPLIIEINNSKLAIGRGMAHKIIVKEC